MTRLDLTNPVKIAEAFFLLTIVAAAVFPQETNPKELPRSAASDVPEPGIKRVPLKPELSNGLAITRIFYDLTGSTGDAARDREIRREIENAVGIRAGDSFDQVAVELALSRVRRIASVASADYALYPSASDQQLILVVSASLGTAGQVENKGVFARKTSDFPVLWQDERSLIRLQVNGGLGVFSDYNPWFANSEVFTAGSPVAVDPPGRGGTTWGEGSIEIGIAGATQMGNAPLYAYGALTWVTSFAVGNDLFRSDARAVTQIEKAYVGVLYKPRKRDVSANFSIGRQNWQLNEGFLISQIPGAVNAGPLPGLYLSPRTAFERTYLGKVKVGKFSAEAFFLDPEELDFVESRTAYRGVNLQYNTNNRRFASLTYFDVPRSKTSFPNPQTGVRVPREGLRTINPRIGDRTLFGIRGLEAITEFAHQWNPGDNVSANAGYGSLGYTYYQRKWRPSLTYRFAHFGGDDPNTAKFERFDAPLSSGLDNWVQGISFKKVVINSNLDSHRVRFNIAPQEQVSYTFDYFYLFAPIKSAGGKTFYGQEVNGAVRWSINKRLFFLGVGGVAVPGAVIRERADGNTKNWYTLQASLFWNL